MELSQGPIYGEFMKGKEYSEEAKQCIRQTVLELLETTTTADKPGMLLGKIQSGKTRTFFGVIALAFDNSYDVAVVFTKGTVALAQQTLERLDQDFKALTQDDQVQIFDIMHFPKNLTDYELKQKLIIVCKKEDDNIRRLAQAFFEVYPALPSKRILIVDDEADFASIGFRKTKEEGIKINKIASQIDEFRSRLPQASFLQVTATPYSLYLQPEDMKAETSAQAQMPVKPALTQLVPVHPNYIGGDYYFEESQEADTIASYLHKEVGPHELRILKRPDGRSLKLEDVLSSPAIRSLPSAIVTFIVGGCIRRLQGQHSGQRPKKYSFIVHTERSRESHQWQERIVRSLVDKLQDETVENSPILTSLTREAYDDLSRSVKLMDCYLPAFDEVLSEVRAHLQIQSVMVTRVNSENDIKQLLDENGQLRLRTPLNIFIGGQILDRGLTISNLIGFFYGRSPNVYQQDTVLQHSRMYGLRPVEDLTVTRFFTTPDIYTVMQKIHEFDSALRDAFEKGGHEAGVVFLRTDNTNKIVPCSPNKILVSTTTTLRPRKRLLPTGFRTKSKSACLPVVQQIDVALADYQAQIAEGRPFLIGLDFAKLLIDLIGKTFDFDEQVQAWDIQAFKAALNYLSRTNPDPEKRDRVWCLVRKNRDIARIRPGGRFQNAPDTKQESDVADSLDPHTPLLMLIRENGSRDNGWDNCPFYWPVLQAPRNTKTVIFASETTEQ